LPDQNAMTGKPVDLTATFDDPGVLDTHTATVEWGNGVTETLELAAGELEFSTSHTYTRPAQYTVVVTVVDKDGGQDSTSFEVAVTSRVYLPLIQNN
jgi:hypothetical protein